MSVRYIIIAVLTLLTANAYAQTDVRSDKNFFAAPIIEVLYYGVTSPSLGYGFALGTEGGVSVGLRGLYVRTLEREVNTLEMTIFARGYILQFDAAKGLFVQLNAGFAIFSIDDKKITVPSDGGTFSFGLSLGWRFLLGNYIFIEPYIRGGYPYYGGAGLSAGVRF